MVNVAVDMEELKDKVKFMVGEIRGNWNWCKNGGKFLHSDEHQLLEKLSCNEVKGRAKCIHSVLDNMRNCVFDDSNRFEWTAMDNWAPRDLVISI